jgi:hypothetical protein
MKMSDKENEYRLGRRPGYQGPRTPAETAGLDKCSNQTSLKQNYETSFPSLSSSPPTRKRRYTSDPESIEIPNDSSVLQTWPHFLILHSLDPTKPFGSISPFKINNAILEILNPIIPVTNHKKEKPKKEEPRKITKLSSGDFLIEVDKEIHSQKLRHIKSLLNIPASVIPHKTLNSSKGIIRCKDISMCSEEEILEGLVDQGVTHVKRIRVKRDGTLVATHSYILEFNSVKLPEAVFLAYIKTNVEDYVPNPLRCFKCQLFGHHKDRCSKQAVCFNCGQNRPENPCPNPSFCVNCHQNHPASDRKCTKWKNEKEILAIKNKFKISHPEARKIVEARTPTNKSYSDTVKTKMVTTSTQTDACTNTPFTFTFESHSQSISKSTVTPIPPQNASKAVQSISPSQNASQSGQSKTTNKSKQNSTNQAVHTKNQKWKKGVNSPKTRAVASPARKNPKALREALVAKNRFAALADLEEMETDNSQSSPSPSPRSTKSRSPSRGASSGKSQNTQSPSSQSPQGTQNQDPRKDSKGKDENPMHPRDDAWEGFPQVVMDSPSPTPSKLTPPKPPDPVLEKPKSEHLIPDKPSEDSQERPDCSHMFEEIDIVDLRPQSKPTTSFPPGNTKPPIPKKPFSLNRISFNS